MKRILIVDDAIDLGRMFQDALKSTHPDIPVTVVPSGEEALLESTRLAFDLLVTDVRLPGMSGLDLVRKIRVRQPNIRVMVITGISMDERLKKQKDDLNPDVFMRKPIGVSAFLDAVDQLLGFSEEPAAPPPAEPAKPAPQSQQEAAKAALLDELAGVFPGTPVEEQKPGKKNEVSKKGTGILSSILPSVPQPVQAPVEEGLAGILSRLRGTLGAVTAILVDERGHPVAQTGDLPDISLENQLVPPMMSALSAGTKISYLLGQSASQSVQAYRGANIDLIIAPVGQFALVLALKSGRSALRLALAFEEALNAQLELSSVLEAMGLHIQTSVEVAAPETLLTDLSEAAASDSAEMPAEILETPLGQDPSLEKFEELFVKKKTGQLGLPDADSFWDALSNEEKKDESTQGVLSFEQALKLGLFPPEES